MAVHDNKSKNKRFVVAFGFIKKGKKFHRKNCKKKNNKIKLIKEFNKIFKK